MKRLLFVVLFAALALPSVSQTVHPPTTHPQPLPVVDCFGPGDTDNRPNYCPDTGTYSTCVKSSGGCTWTSCDGEHTSTSTDSQCCCTSTRKCPQASYWAICVG